jgi:uncharacterized protein YbbK (DUF523 family)
MFAVMERPRVGISRCLLGDDVRYDGTNKRDAALIDALSCHVEWVPLCPEVEIGMGTPREPIELVACADGVPSAGAHVRLLGANSGEDWTDRMQAWARERLRSLVALGLSGYVCKARSPSCGTRDVPVRRGSVERIGRGLFAQALVAALPDVPVADEEELACAAGRDDFLRRIRAHHGRAR